MRPLKNHLILFDAECPMCRLYTSAFTHSGMLDPSGRTPYQDILANPVQTAATCPLIDRQRAVNEIALVDKTTGQVIYGIDSLFAIIGHSFPVFRPLFSWRPFRWAMRKLYSFISYNRKVIIPAPSAASPATPTSTAPAAPSTTTPPAAASPATPSASATAAPQPSFRLRYRIAWLVFCTAIAAAILTPYARLLSAILPVGASYREFLVCTGQLFYQGLVVSFFAPAKRWDYLGHMTTISLAGSLALLPVLALAPLIHLSPYVAAAWFLIVVGLMLAEHLRRTRLLSLDATLTATWLAYRGMVLLLIVI